MPLAATVKSYTVINPNKTGTAGAGCPAVDQESSPQRASVHCAPLEAVARCTPFWRSQTKKERPIRLREKVADPSVVDGYGLKAGRARISPGLTRTAKRL